MSGFRRRLCVALALLCGVSFGVTGLGAPAVAAAPTVQAATAGPLPTPQVNGIIFSVAIVGNTVYAGGRFSKARPSGAAPGTNEVTRNNVLAFNLQTGQLLPWAPAVTGTQYSSPNNPGPYCKSMGNNQWVCDTVFRIKASPSGDRIYVGGDFDRVNGQRRTKIAAFDTATGNLVSTFNPRVSSRVRGISVTGDRVYIGGAFATVNGTARTRLAALSPTGALQAWNPSADKEVFSVLAAPANNKVLIGGNFDRINNVARRGLMMVDANTGANSTLAWRDPSGYGTYTDIVTDGAGTAYFSAYDFGGGNPRFEGRAAVDIASGNTKWEDGCYGDTQGLAVANGVVYAVSHTHDCRAVGELPELSPRSYWRLTAETATATGTAPTTRNHVQRGEPIPSILPWLPYTNPGPADSYWKNGTWAIDANSQYVVAGGEFTTVNGAPQQGLTRFAARGVPGAINAGPQTPFRAPSVTRSLTGTVTVSWKATWDRQNWDIRYDLMRIGTAAPIYSVTRESRSWNLPTMSYVDPDAPKTGRVEYWVRAVDADGASIGSPRGGVG